MLSSKRSAFIAGGLVALVVIAAALAQPRKPVKHVIKTPGSGAGVHGSVVFVGGTFTVTHLTPVNFRTAIYVPDFNVFLRNSAGATVATAKTDLFGHYRFRWQPAGTYRLCWNGAGWIAGCYPDPIVIGSNTKYPSPAMVRAAVTDTSGPIWGRVTLADGGSPWTYDEYFAIERTAKIDVATAKNRVLSARTNVAGDFVIPNVPRSATRVTAELENIQETRALSGSAAGALAFTLRNRAPVIRSVVAMRSGAGVRDVDPGETLDVEIAAIDPDGDAIQYEWKSGPASGTISASGAHAKWVLPNTAGAYTVYVIAHDGKGGYARQSATVNAGPPVVRFSGEVVSQSGVVVAGASVSVNATSTAANAGGAFTFTVPRAVRYVFNISKPGFALYSRIFDHGTSGVYPLVPAQLTTIDPTHDVDIVDRRSTLERRKIEPVHFHLDPNSLVDADGNLPSGPVMNAVATLDVANSEMPGDYGAMQNGSETNLISFGAAFAEFTDAGGRRYNLAPGKTAKMVLPVPLAMRPSAAPQITLWSYDERTGYWVDDEGTATYDAAQGAYVGNVRHFSTLNTDLSKTTATCLAITLDSTIPANQIRIRARYDSGPELFVQTPELVLDNTLNALWRLPPNDNIKLEGLDPTTNAVMGNMSVLDNGTTPVANNVVNVGGPTTPLWPGPPFSNCHPVTVKLDVPNWLGFPGSPFLTYASPGTDAQAIGYYQAVNPGSTYNAGTQTWSGGTRSTLGDWWTQAKFDPTTGAGGTRASYLNYNDLGFGRDMHIRQAANGDVFAYVTNYGNPDQNLLNADYANNQDLAHQGATVCMETTSQAGVAGRVVKFFVYNGGGPTAKLINSANLDGFGPKFVPNLCQNCHGGSFYAPANAASPTALDVSLRSALQQTVGSSFREFDLHSYRFPGSSVTPAPAVLPDFFTLNQLVKASGPQQAIIDLINGWYAASSTVEDVTWFPAPAWTPHPDFYHQLVAESCRTCHIAFGSDQDQGLNWNSYAQLKQKHTGFDAIGSAVCSARYMPHALITYRNFWLSTGPHRPGVLASFSAADWTAIGTCP